MNEPRKERLIAEIREMLDHGHKVETLIGTMIATMKLNRDRPNVVWPEGWLKIVDGWTEEWDQIQGNTPRGFITLTN